MARYSEGISGSFSGKVGPIIGSSRNGVPYMKSKGNPRTSLPSEAELANRKKFSNAHAWLQPLLNVVRVGFNGYSKTKYGFIAAKSYVLNHAMAYGQVLPELVKISLGDLPLSSDFTVNMTEDRKLHFNWSSAHIEDSNNKDQLMVLAYHPEDGTAIYEIHGAFRETGVQVIDLVRDLTGKTIHVFAAFIAADRSRQSDSLYFGPITVT
jgi:hypothetical protein